MLAWPSWPTGLRRARRRGRQSITSRARREHVEPPPAAAASPGRTRRWSGASTRSPRSLLRIGSKSKLRLEMLRNAVRRAVSWQPSGVAASHCTLNGPVYSPPTGRRQRTLSGVMPRRPERSCASTAAVPPVWRWDALQLANVSLDQRRASFDAAPRCLALRQNLERSRAASPAPAGERSSPPSIRAPRVPQV